MPVQRVCYSPAFGGLKSSALWRIRNALCRPAGFDRDVQAEVKPRHESEDGCHYGRFPNFMGLLRVVDASRPVIVWNMVAELTNGMVVGAYFYFARRQTIL